MVLSFLTNRFLLLDGNVSPTANIVSYGGRVDNSRRSRITDLIDLPVPWAEPETEIVDPSQLSSEVARALGMPDPELERLMEAPEPPPLPVHAHLGLPDLEFDDLLTEELPTLELDIEDEDFAE